MNKFLIQEYGNPSSIHEFGENARKAVDEARRKLASLISAKSNEIIFTSSGTESNNLAIQGLALAYPLKKKIVISAIEHASILETCNYMKSKGYDIVRIPVNNEGIINIDKLENELNKYSNNILLVSIMHINNEIGVVQDIGRIGRLCREKGVLFHTDAVQSFAKEKIDVRKMNIDLLSASAHKIHGPKGVGFLYIRDGVKIKPIIQGGGQEKGIRSGTENVAGIAGFAKAAEISDKINRANKKKIINLRDKLMNELEKIGGKINGTKINRIYNNVNVSFKGIDGETLVLFLSHKGIYASTGSACSSRQAKESQVLKAIGLSESEIKGSLRLTLNEDMNEKDVGYVVKTISNIIKKLNLSFLWGKGKDIKKLTNQIMKEIDEGETDD